MDVANTGGRAARAGPFSSAWVARGRLVLAVALVWGALHFVIDRTVLAQGLDRPVVILASESGLSAAAAVAVLLWIGAYVGGLVAGVREGARALFIVGLGLALWAVGGGTMDDWLLRQNQLVAGPSAAAYRPLLGEYVYLAIVFTGVAALGGLAALGRRAADRRNLRLSLRRTFAVASDSPSWREGVFALVATTVIGGFLVFVLSGPRVSHTYRGQVYFAVGVGFILAVLAARRITGVQHPLWYWPAPFIVGIVGVLLAIAKPALPQPFQHLDMIPPWALVRPLPVEMVGVGLAAITWTLRTTSRLSGEEAG
jgi:hypothetical protein